MACNSLKFFQAEGVAEKQYESKRSVEQTASILDPKLVTPAGEIDGAQAEPEPNLKIFSNLFQLIPAFSQPLPDTVPVVGCCSIKDTVREVRIGTSPLLLYLDSARTAMRYPPVKHQIAISCSWIFPYRAP